MSNLIRLPGLIDIHVHLRDPGQTYKEDFYTGTCAALAGGVTAVFDMPNNLQPILTREKLLEKLEIVGQKAVCDFGLYFASDGNNTVELKKVTDNAVGLKVFLNVSNNNIQIGDYNLLEKVFQNWPAKKIIIIHTEVDNADMAINLSRKYGNRIHITHINQKKLLEKIIIAKSQGLSVTCDVTPHHLFLTDKEIIKMGGFGMVKPPITIQEDAEFFWKNLDKIDCIATDHAPHTVEEKKSASPPSGMPGLETMLPLLLTAVRSNKITIDELIRLTNINPQKIFGFKQNSNTYIEVDPNEKYRIENRNLKTKCGWSPFDGWEVFGAVKNVFIRGTKVFEDGKILVSPGFGKNVL